MSRIMAVEDDQSIAGLIELYLRHDGHRVDAFVNGAEALRAWESAASSAPYDLVVLDLMLPGLDGRGVARRIRAQSNVPILMLTALDDMRDKLEGFGLGADDYLTKPFDPNELVARVRAILRRAASAPPAAPDKSTLTFGRSIIDLDGRRLTVDGEEVPLRAREFDLLALMAEHAGIVLTRQQLLDRVWPGELDSDTRTVDVHVSRLRERMAPAEADFTIDTIRSVGYRLTVHSRP
jgi:DNA-binding response OmpR family regulator